MTTAKQQVARQAARVREAIQARDAAIVAMSKEGASLREIGEAAGLSHVAIAKILVRAGEDP